MSVCDNFINDWDNIVAGWFHEEIGIQKQYGKLVNMEYLPEPYWGNPNNCSLVIVNYNPGGGNDRNPHIYRGCCDCPKNQTRIVNFVKQTSYSNLMLPFPGLMSKEEIKKFGLDWFIDYDGYKWWQMKLEWINGLAKNLKVPTIKDGLKPFAIELCPWHKPQWTIGNSNTLLTYPLRKVVEKYVMNVIHEAIDNSEAKFAIFIGKFHCKFLESFGFSKVPNNYEDKPCKSKERYYHIYQKQYKGHCHRVIVTYAKGSNRHPGKDFEKYEKVIISKYINKTICYG